MKLIVEEIDDVECIVEGEGPQASHYITGVFMQAERPNKNGRLYPKNILEREVLRYTNELIKENRAVGELGHPPGPGINYDRVSHKIVELKPTGNDYIGKAKIMPDMPCGAMAKALLDNGIKLGVSSRGVGNVRKQGNINIVEDNFRLAVAADIVHSPSAPDAFVNGIMENADWIYENGVWKEAIIEQAKETIENTPKIDLMNVGIRLFESFLYDPSYRSKKTNRPFKNSPLHEKTDEELKYIVESCKGVAKAAKKYAPQDEKKYTDRMNEAQTILDYRNEK